MKTPPIGHATQLFETSLGRRWGLFTLFRTATTPMLIRTGIAVAVAWIPLVVFSAAHGGTAFLSFLTDYASQSRFLIVLPVLILAEPPLQKRHHMVANHFEEFMFRRTSVLSFRRPGHLTKRPGTPSSAILCCSC